MIKRFLGDAFWILSCQFWSIVLHSGARLPIHTLNYWTEQSVVPCFYLEVCLNVTFLIVDLWQSCVCFIRSGVTRCTLLLVLSLDRMCQHGYMRCSGHTSVHLRTASLQNLAVQQDFHSLSVSLWNYLANPVFDGVGLTGFKSRANASLLA